VEPEAGLKGIVLQIGEHLAEAGLQTGMFFKKLPRLPQKLFGGQTALHHPWP